MLPAATWLEMDYIGDFWKRHGYILLPAAQGGGGARVPKRPRDAQRSGPPVGQGEHWWEDFEQGLDYILEPMGITFQDFKKMDYLRGDLEYRKYEKKGFSTPTRKFELSSTLLEKWATTPCPSIASRPRAPRARPSFMRNTPTSSSPACACRGFFHTENLGLPWLRDLHRDPVVEIHRRRPPARA